MKFDLKNFKKIHEDKARAVFMHPEGHLIQVKKASLKPMHLKSLEKLPHFDDGGEVPEETIPIGQSAQIPESLAAQPQGDEINYGPLVAQQQAEDAPYGTAPQDTGSDQTAETQAAPSNYQIAAPQRQPGSSPSMQGLPGYGEFKAGLGQAEQGLQEQAQANQQIGQQDVDLQSKFQNDLQSQMSDYQQKRNDIFNEVGNMVDDASMQHIDPNAYMENMSTGGKIATAIGLIAGGLASGFNGGRNPALEFLNAQIERNVQAQKANIDQKNNVMRALIDQGHSIDGAAAISTAFQQQLLASKLEQAKAMAATPQAQAQLDQAAGQLKMQSANTLNQYAMTQSLMSGSPGQSGDPASRIMVLQHLGVIPNETATQALKELGTRQNNQKEMNAVLQSFDRASNENTVLGRAEHAGFAPASVEQLRVQIMPYLKDAEGRVNEREIDIMNGLIPQPGDGPRKTAEKRAGLATFLAEKSATPTLDSLKPYGVRTPPIVGASGIPSMRGLQ